MNDERALRKQILSLTNDYFKSVHAPALKERSSGKGKIVYAARLFSEAELKAAVSSVLDFWLTYGDYSREFERHWRFYGIYFVKD